MKKTILIAALLQPVLLHEASASTSPATGKQLSGYLKHKISPKLHKKVKKHRNKRRATNVSVKVYAAKQYTVDLLVTCRKKNILLTYNKIDKKFCTQKFKCHRSLRAAISPYCKR